MELSEKLVELKIQLGESDDDDSTLLSYLDDAKAVILNRMYHYPNDVDYATLQVPAMYERKQIRIAVYLLNKRGAEGETQHIENGTHRNYKSPDVPEDMLWDIYPVVSIPR